ncbi:MAG TPA: DUF3459 domain-containing protein, partial [Burkholderiales bacterium]
PENAAAVSKGRREFLTQFPSIAAGGHAWLLDPASPESFERCKLDLSEREAHSHAVALHRDLLKLRRDEAAFAGQPSGSVDGAVLGPEAFALRFFDTSGDDRLLIINFGIELILSPVPEPLLAAPVSREWTLLWSSEGIAYGGDGTAPPLRSEAWHLPAHCALVFGVGV